MTRTANSNLYLTAEWISLRDRVLARDGHCCRNCGHGDTLEVHHWLPFSEYRHLVDERGYSLSDNPLIVDHSGLVTLCKDCHAALTERRIQHAALQNPELFKLEGRPVSYNNIFEIWALNEQKLPFKVRKESWNKAVSQHYLIEKIEISKWPYGKAWGRYVRNGDAGDTEKVPNSGTYTWIKVED